MINFISDDKESGKVFCQKLREISNELRNIGVYKNPVLVLALVQIIHYPFRL